MGQFPSSQRIPATSRSTPQDNRENPRPPPGRTDTAEAAAERIQPKSTPDLECLHILLVDDEPELCFLMSRLLQISGHRTTIAVDGYDALAKIEKEAGFDLVVMDQNMPGMRGEDAVEKIRERGWNTPVLITSGDLDILQRPRLRQPGVAAIAKPFNMPELLAKAMDLVRESATRQR